MTDALIATDLPRFLPGRPFEDRLSNLRNIERVAYAALIDGYVQLAETPVKDCSYWRALVRDRKARWVRAMIDVDNALGRETFDACAG